MLPLGMPGFETPACAQQLIKEAFLRLYENHSLKEITVERLAKEAGYSRAAFYRYFHSTADVLAAVEEDVLPIPQSAYIFDHASTISVTLFKELYIDYFATNEHALRILLLRDSRGDLRQKLAGTIYPAFYAFFENRNNVPEDDLDRMTAYLIESKLNQMSSWAKDARQSLAEYMRMPLETIERDFWSE